MFDITSRVVDLLGVGLTQSGASALTSETDLAAAGTRKAIVSASLTAESDAFSSAVRRTFAAAVLSAESDLSATGQSTLYVSITADFDSVLSADANATFRSLTADLSGESNLSADGAIKYGGLADLSADSDLSGTGTRVAVGAAALSSDSGVTAAGVRTTFSDAALTGDLAVDVTAAPVRVRYGDAALDSNMDCDVAAEPVRVTYVSAGLSAEMTSMQATASPVFRLRMASAKRSITDDWLLKRYPIDAGLSLIVKDGVVTQVEVPSQTELAEADFYFLGGRNNPITSAQRAVLVAAGFGSYIEED